MELFALDYFFISHQRVFWLYIVSAIVIAFFYIKLFPLTANEYKSRVIWWHKSAQMDYKYFFVSSLIKVLFILPLILSSKDVALWMTLFLQEHLGYMRALNVDREIVVILYTLSIFIVGDFTRYWLHRLLHTVAFLWRIHQVHHSAEVLNPLTFYRVHPIENILFGIRYAVSVGLITGTFIYIFGANIGLVQIIGANIFVFIFGILGANLRHSHIPIRYGDILEKIFISPYQHQLHHSVTYTDKNFGGALAIWDYIFKTIHIEKTRVNIKYGINGIDSYNTVLELLFKPFKYPIKRKNR